MINNDKRVKLEKLIERGNRRMMNTHRFQSQYTSMNEGQIKYLYFKKPQYKIK